MLQSIQCICLPAVSNVILTFSQHLKDVNDFVNMHSAQGSDYFIIISTSCAVLHCTRVDQWEVWGNSRVSSDPDWFFLIQTGSSWGSELLEAPGLVLCCRLDRRTCWISRVERWTSGRLEGCLSAFLLLSTSRTSTCNRQLESSDACQASSLPALLRFQPGVTAALLLAANDGSSTRWQCSSGIFGSTEAAPVLTQQDLNTNQGSFKQ